MKFRIDKRYILIRLLKILMAYAIGTLIVWLLLRPSDFEGFLLSCGISSIIVYVIFFFPWSIEVKNGSVSFVKENSAKKVTIPKNQISGLKVTTSPYNILLLTTRQGEQYRLYPTDIHALVEQLQSV